MENTEQQKKDEQFMRRALVEAEAARDEGEIPGGAVVVAAAPYTTRRTCAQPKAPAHIMQGSTVT